MTRREPGEIVVLTNGDADRFASTYEARRGGSRIGKKGITEEEFVDIFRTETGYEVHVLTGHKTPSGKTRRVYFEEKNLPEGEIGAALKNLSVGDNVTLHITGKDTHEIAEKRNAYLHAEEVTSQAVSGNHMYEVQGNGNNRFVNLKITNSLGWHNRPATLTCKVINLYESEVFAVTPNHRAQANSIMGLLMLIDDINTDLTLRFEAEGSDAYECVKDIASLFAHKFYEEEFEKDLKDYMKRFK